VHQALGKLSAGVGAVFEHASEKKKSKKKRMPGFRRFAWLVGLSGRR